jgi:hypothetical protein
MQPFTMNHREGADPHIDLSFLLERPIVRDGFVRLRNRHLVRPNGERLRLWGVNITDWSRGSVMLPSKDDAPIYAAMLARFGVNYVRLHFLDLFASRGIIDGIREDTRHFYPEQLDKLDFWIAELKRHGIYIDLNLMVGRTYKDGDGVQDYDQIGWVKAVSYFAPCLIELQKDYARQLLTHYNLYMQAEYRHDSAIIIIELVNENSPIDAWYHDSLFLSEHASYGPNFRSLPAFYADMVTHMYNEYLQQHLDATELAAFRMQAGISDNEPIPRLRKSEFATTLPERFQTEAAFYMDVERNYFREMKIYLKETLGVQSLLIGTP